MQIKVTIGRKQRSFPIKKKQSIMAKVNERDLIMKVWIEDQVLLLHAHHLIEHIHTLLSV